jgi:hypothetical protein
MKVFMLAMACASATALGCKSSSVTEPASVFGMVTRVISQDTINLVGAQSRDDRQVYLQVGRGVSVTVRTADGTTHAGGYTDISVGDSIEAKHSEIEFRSSPPQYVATRVVITKH